jgi:hypothetical protein
MSPFANSEETFPPIAVRGGPEALRPYLGKWVALTDDGEILSAGKTTREASEAASKSGKSGFALQFVPEHRVVG